MYIKPVKTLDHAFVTSRVDYCNSVFLLRRRRSFAACSVSAWSLFVDAWRPAMARYSSASAVQVAVTVHRSLRHRAPWYLADYGVPVSEVPGRQHLRSARCHQLSVPQVRRSTVGTRAFAGPTVWNSLPLYLCDPAVYSEQFRRELFAEHWKR